MAIPKEMQDTYDEIAPWIHEFCEDHLDDAYKALCLRLLEKLCRKRPSPLLSGNGSSWAAGIVYLICAQNYIFSKDNPHHMAADDIAAAFNLSAGTAGAKASGIRKLLKISSWDHQWLLPQFQSDFDLSDIPPAFRASFERFRR